MINTKEYFVQEVLSYFEEFKFAFERRLARPSTPELVVVVAEARFSCWCHQDLLELQEVEEYSSYRVHIDCFVKILEAFLFIHTYVSNFDSLVTQILRLLYLEFQFSPTWFLECYQAVQ